MDGQRHSLGELEAAAGLTKNTAGIAGVGDVEQVARRLDAREAEDYSGYMRASIEGGFFIPATWYIQALSQRVEGYPNVLRRL